MKTNLSLRDELLSAVRRIVAKFWAQEVGQLIRLQSVGYHAKLRTKIGVRSRIASKMLLSTLLMLTFCIGNALGTETTLAAWSFTSSSYPSNNSNFSATSGTMSTNSTFCMNGSGSTWNSATGKGYAFTSVSSVVITLKLNQKLAAGAQITLAADVFYNKASNKPVGSYAITTKVGSAAASSTGVGTTTWTLSNSSANKTSTYTTQAEIASGTTIQFILTASGSSGSGQAYFNNVTIKSTTYTVTYNANSGSGSVPTDATAYCSKAIVTVKGNTGPVSRDGYTFGGWNTNTSGTGTNYTAGSGTFTITANTTLYAKWIAAASCTSNPTVSAGSLKGSVTSSSSATVQCTSGITNIGGAGCSLTSYGFAVGTSTSPIIGNALTGTGKTYEVGTSIAASTGFEKLIDGLSASTQYYVRPYATNGYGTAYGTQFSFTTLAACTSAPTVTAGSTGTITKNSAEVNCSSGITSLGTGGCAITSYGFAYGTSANPTISGSKTVVGTEYTTTGTSFTATLTGLTEGQTYYVRPYATNGYGTAYGDQVTFGTPKITVVPAGLVVAFGDKKVGGTYTETFTVSGVNLQGNITITPNASCSGLFSVDKSSLTPTDGSVTNEVITITYTPTTAGSHGGAAYINVESTNAQIRSVMPTGTGKWEVTWNLNGGTTTSLVADGTKPTFPSTPSSCDGTSTTFIGWATAPWTGKIASLAGKTVHADNSTMSNITANGTTFYAVFAKQTGSGAPTWVQTTSVAVDDVVVIAEIDHVADGKTGKELSGFSTTSTVYGLYADYSTTPAATKTWTVVAGYNSTGVAFKDGSNKYLWWDAADNKNSLNVNSTLSAESSWTVSTESSRAKIQNNNTTTRVICWNESSPRFAAYANKSHGDETSSGSGKYFYYPVFYKQTPGYTYSDYLTTCCTSYDVTLAGSGSVSGGTFSADLASACEGNTVTLSASICSGYTQGAWTITKTSNGDNVTASVLAGNTITMPAYGITVNLATTAKTDHFIDKMHETAGYTGEGASVSGCDQTVPNLSNTTPASECEGEHYKFVGWVDEDHVNTDGTLLAGFSIVAGGTTSWNATGTNYYAIWAKEE